jgi:Ca-activated chloride channel family protein
MSFFWPHAFWLLAVPLALVALDLTRRRRAAAVAHPKIVRAEADRDRLVLAEATNATPTLGRARWRLALGLMLAVVASARPQWGRIEEPVFDQAREIVIAVDLSRSMLAEDVKPARLDRAKLLITSLLERLEGERVGLIVFAGTSFLQSPLSSDYEILREFLPALGPDYLPEGGTDFKGLLETALDAFGTDSTADRFLIVLSDGEAQTEDWKSALPRLVERGIRVLGLGIGTESGSMIPDGEGSFVKDERGAVVMTRLQPGTLRDLAEQTHGVYTDASQWVDLAALLRQTVEAGRAGEFTETSRARLAERFQWALGPAVLLLLWSFVREFPVQPKARPVRLSPPPSRSNRSSAAGATVGCLLVLAFAPPPADAAQAPAAPDLQALAAPLSALVSQLAEREAPAARDYGDLARTTLTYGQRIKETGQPVPAGPIRDGIEATRAGEALDAQASDWPSLRKELEALLDTPEQPPQQPPPDEQQDDQNQESGESGEGDSKQGEGEKNSSKDSQSDSGPQQQPGEDGKEGESTTPPPQSGQSAFGEMSEQPPPPPPPPPQSGETQRIGGQQERRDEAAGNPELAIPLQKLDQLRNQDSPARLFQLMQDPQGKPAEKGRDW